MRLQELIINKPKKLKKGDTIGIVAPAWAFNRLRFRKGVAKLEQLGFKVKYDKSIFSNYWSMAGHDEQRAAQINDMFADKEVKAIFCAKAGYGSIRTIPFLDAKIIRSNPKIFVGYSDITVLLEYIQRVANMVVFHGPVVAGDMHRNMSKITEYYLLHFLTQSASVGKVTFPNMKTLKQGRGSGKLVGGNMSMLVSGIGTPYDIDTDFKILFLEDIGEDLEQIDNILWHLKLAGKFKRVKGVIFGRMVDCYDYSGKKYKIEQVIANIMKDIDVPIVHGFPSGHARGRGANVTLPLGAHVTLDADNCCLVFNEPAVK